MSFLMMSFLVILPVFDKSVSLMMSFLVILPVFDKSASLCPTGKLFLELHVLVLVIPAMPQRTHK